MEFLTILVFFAAVLTALAVNVVMQQRFLTKGQGFLRSTAKSGLLGTLAALVVIAAYFVVGTFLARLLG